MKTLFPEGLDFLNLTPGRADKNSIDTGSHVTSDDLFYILHEIEKKIGINGSIDPMSLEFRLSEAIRAVLELEKESAQTNKVLNGLLFLQMIFFIMNFRSGSIAVERGVNVVTFSEISGTNYFPQVELYSVSGERLGAVPLLNTLTTSSFSVDCMDYGTLFYKITPFIV